MSHGKPAAVVLDKLKAILIVLPMSEDSAKAGLLLRVTAKAIDIIIIAAAADVIPQAGYFAGILYLAISDGLFDGRSLGKKVMRLKVVSARTGTAADFRDSIIRNSLFVVALLVYRIPLLGWFPALLVAVMEYLLMLGNADGLRLGDELAGTKVLQDMGHSPQGMNI